MAEGLHHDLRPGQRGPHDPEKDPEGKPVCAGQLCTVMPGNALVMPGNTGNTPEIPDNTPVMAGEW